LWPTGMIFDKEESRVLKISGHDMRLVDFTSIRGSFNVTNDGKHFVHFREMYNNYIQLNVL
jgi:hypothetical protein